MCLLLSKVHSCNTLKRPNVCWCDRLADKRGLSGTSSWFGDLWGEEGRFVSLCNDFRYDPPGVVNIPGGWF